MQTHATEVSLSTNSRPGGLSSSSKLFINCKLVNPIRTLKRTHVPTVVPWIHDKATVRWAVCESSPNPRTYCVAGAKARDKAEVTSFRCLIDL